MPKKTTSIYYALSLKLSPTRSKTQGLDEEECGAYDKEEGHDFEAPFPTEQLPSKTKTKPECKASSNQRNEV
jgi:hypothetical protein